MRLMGEYDKKNTLYTSMKISLKSTLSNNQLIYANRKERKFWYDQSHLKLTYPITKS